MKILVISDTHISTLTNNIPPKILEEAKTADICLHAGDFTEYKVFEEFSHITKIYGACGNMDSDEIRKNLPPQQIIDAGGIKIGLAHGRGAPDKIICSMEQSFAENFANIDLFVFGHSHYPLDKVVGDKIYFNPGSPTDKIFSPYNSYGIIEINGKQIERRLIRIE